MTGPTFWRCLIFQFVAQLSHQPPLQFMNSFPSNSSHFPPYLQNAMDSFRPKPTQAPFSPYELLFRALYSIPFSHYCLASLLCSLVFLYNFLEFHFLEDVFSGFRGNPVSLTFNPRSQIYEGVVSKCRILHGR